MLAIILRSLGYGLIGLIAAPVIAFVTVLILAHALDPRCGTPGDSGGCEMGAASVGFAAAPLGLVAGAIFGTVQGVRRRRAGLRAAPPAPHER